MWFNKLFNFKPKKNIVAVLDIGSNKICCLVSEIEANGDFKVIGVGHQVSLGLKNGFITNLKELEESIVRAVEVAEKSSGVMINKVIITFSGAGISSMLVKSRIKLMGGVEDSDLSNVVRSAIAKIDQDKNEILHCFPLEYRVNEADGIKNPKGIYAETLSATLALVTIPSTNFFNIVNCVARCHLDVEDVIASPYSSVYSLLTEEELEIGTVLIDIGCTTTSYMIWRDNQLLAIGDIPIGGFHVTSDIAKVLSTNFQTAERIKILHSRAISSYSDQHRMIDIPVDTGGIEGTDLESVSCAVLNEIVAARICEIFDTLKKIILKNIPDQSLLNRVVLAGGTAQLMDIAECASKVLGSKVRVAKPIVPDGILKDNRVVFYSSAIGCLYHNVKKFENAGNSTGVSTKAITVKLLDWLRAYI